MTTPATQQTLDEQYIVFLHELQQAQLHMEAACKALAAAREVSDVRTGGSKEHPVYHGGWPWKFTRAQMDEFNHVAGVMLRFRQAVGDTG